MPESKVFRVCAKGIGPAGEEIGHKSLSRMFTKGLELVQKETPLPLFRERDRVGIKINTLSGKKLSTQPEVSLAAAEQIIARYNPREIIIWDRSNRELRSVGYSLVTRQGKIKIFGTDTRGIGYDAQLVAHRNIGSLFSRIQSGLVSSSVSLALLKDHGLAGVSAGMKNYYGAVHNPNKYHDTLCNPYIAELFDCPPVKKKHRLTVIDCTVVQYHRGPAFHSQWSARMGAFLFSLDPVSADAAGWKIIEDLRAKKGLPSLEEENRRPVYLQTAESMNLGHCSPGSFELIDVET